jgi:hypothetical protein
MGLIGNAAMKPNGGSDWELSGNAVMVSKDFGGFGANDLAEFGADWISQHKLLHRKVDGVLDFYNCKAEKVMAHGTNQFNGIVVV